VLLADVIDLQQWRKIQELFADAIGVSIYTVDRRGNLLIKPSKPARICEEVRNSTLFGLKTCTDFMIRNIQIFLETQRETISCPCGLMNFVVPITVNEKEMIGFVIVGPVIVGGRKKKEEYAAICEQLGINVDTFTDALAEIKVLSHKSADSVIMLLREAITYMVKLGYQKNKLEQWLPGFLKLSEANRTAHAHLYLNKLLHALLDIALAATHGDSGAVMVYDKMHHDLYVKAAKGHLFDLMIEMKVNYDNSIAGCVAAERKGYLIDDTIAHTQIRSLLKRDDVTRSMVVPIKMGETVYGVFSVNCHSDNSNFNKRNLELLCELGELTAVAISSFNIPDVTERPSV